MELWRSTNRICQINGFTENAWEKVPLRGSGVRKFSKSIQLLVRAPDRIQKSYSKAVSHSAVPRIAVIPPEPSQNPFGSSCNRRFPV
jgi:hypothetical protein